MTDDSFLDWFLPQIIATALKIERYNRAAAVLSQEDEIGDGASRYAGITAATSDSTGDWVVRESLPSGLGPRLSLSTVICAFFCLFI